MTDRMNCENKINSLIGWSDIALCATAVCLLVLIVGGFNLTINYTGSIPEGLYYVQDDKAEKGDYTLVTSPKVLRRAEARGYIASGTFIGKRIIAGAGDVICIKSDGVFLNGHRVPASNPLLYDSAGRPMPKLRGCIKLSGRKVFVMGEEPKSFDSRYFGPITSYKETLVPVVTF